MMRQGELFVQVLPPDVKPPELKPSTKPQRPPAPSLNGKPTTYTR